MTSRVPALSARTLRSAPFMAWAVHLLVVTATAGLTVAWSPERNDRRPKFNGLAHYLVSPLALWDGGWYVRIAREGYGRRKMAAAFWPVYPLLLRAGHWLTSAPYAVVGLILSNAFFLAALLVLYSLVRIDYGLDVAIRTVWLTALSPFSFFFSAVYTESLFLLLTVGALLLARTGRWTAAALTASLAALTRNSGILILLPIFVVLIQRFGLRPRGWWRQGIQLAAAALAPAAFAWHLDRVWGDPLLMVHIQSEWARVQALPWDTLLKAYDRTTRIYLSGRHDCVLSLDTGAVKTCRAALQITIDQLFDDLEFFSTLGVLLLFPYALRRLMLRDALYLSVGFIAPLFNPATYDPLLSMPRFLLVMFPLFIALACLIRWTPLFVATMVGSTAALCILLTIFSLAYFIS